MNNYLISFCNLILNEILNNEEELVHIDSLITFKDLIKRFFENKNHADIEEKSNEIVKNIKNNIQKTYEKCEGLLFNSELVKNCYDAKDILVIITEYVSEYRLQSLKISIKLISQFQNDNKNHYLKNSNTILFYSLKNFFPNEKNPEKFNAEIFEYLSTNKNIIKNLIYSLLKRNNNFSNFSSDANEEIISICEFVSNFLIKSENLIFNEEEIKIIFENIFSLWKNGDQEIENKITTCIVALTNKFEFLENFKSVGLFISTKITHLLNLLKNNLQEILKINKNEKISLRRFDTNEINFKDINKYLSLFVKFFKIEKISNFILKEICGNFLKIKNELHVFYRRINKKLIGISVENFENDKFLTEENSEEDSVYDLLLLIYKKISEEIIQVLKGNITLENFKEDGNLVKKKGGCCGGAKKTKKNNDSGCCGGGEKKQQKSSGCCGGNNKEDSDEEFDFKPKEIKINTNTNEDNENKEKKHKKCKKVNCCKNKKDGKKKHKLNTTKEENANFLKEFMLNILLPLEEENNKMLIDDGSKEITNLPISLFFDIHDSQIFKNSLGILKIYIESSFCQNSKKLEIYKKLTLTIKNFNEKFLSNLIKENNEEEESNTKNLIKFHFMIFDTNNKLSNEIGYINYIIKFEKFSLLKFLLKSNLLFLRNLQKNPKIEGYKLSLSSHEIFEDFSNKLKFLIKEKIPEIYFNKKENNLEKEIINYNNQLHFTLNNIETNTNPGNLLEKSTNLNNNFNSNLFSTQVYFTNLNNFVYKIISFNYFHLKKNKKIIEDDNNSMQIDENNNTPINPEEKLSEIYQKFIESFQKISDLNTSIANNEINSLNIFENLNEINKIKNFLNFLILTNDKNLLEILKKLLDLFSSIINNQKILEEKILKENEKENSEKLINLYFSINLFVDFINNINTTNLNKEKLNFNFLKINKNLFEENFNENKISQFLILFKKELEINFKGNDENNENISDTNFELKKEFISTLECNKKNGKKSYLNFLSNFILNFYLNFNFDNLYDNVDIILDNTIRFISKGICIEKSAKNLQNIIQYIGKNFFQKKGYSIGNIIDNLLKVIFLYFLIFRF